MASWYESGLASSRHTHQPQSCRAFGDFLLRKNGLGLELDVDRAAAGEVGRRNSQPAILADRELDADRDSWPAVARAG